MAKDKGEKAKKKEVSLADRVIKFAKKIYRPHPFPTNKGTGDVTLKTGIKRVKKLKNKTKDELKKYGL